MSEIKKHNYNTIIQHIEETSEEYITKLYENKHIYFKTEFHKDISLADLKFALNRYLLLSMNVKQKDLQTIEDIYDTYIFFGGDDFEKFLIEFITSFEKIDNPEINKCLLNLCKKFNIL